MVIVLAAISLLAGCSGGGGAGPTPPPTTAAPPSTASPSTTEPPTTPPPAAAPASAPAAGAVPRCTSGELSVSLGTGDAGAGSVYRPLIFTNMGRATCELRGFPGVSYVAGDDGHQVGPAAEMSGDRGGQIDIAPSGTAIAPLQLVNVQNFDAAVCRPTPVRGLRVYPPGETASVFVPMDGTGCAGTPPQPQLFVQTMRAP
ncbi:hypothetical protein GCM10009609_22740 [Pseudonocardia aurantiaca]